MEGNASVHQVNPESRITSSEGKAGFLKTWGPGFDRERAGRRGGWTTQSVRGNYNSFIMGINLTGSNKCISLSCMYIL